ncbi:MAG: hypothetical protein QNJ32_31190 [Xenococcaceae cyanobacterium MO_167.B27]|nr:hypothetical protein [Xenococcaceae cyanobacterium MO_167.B27]
MSELYFNAEAAAFDYVKTALETGIPQLTEQERLVFDSIAKFGSPPNAEQFVLPERVAMWLHENYEDASLSSTIYRPTTSKESERLELANNLRIIAQKLETGQDLPNKDALIWIPLEARKIQLEQSYLGEEATGARIIAPVDPDEKRLRNFADFVENNQQLSMVGYRNALGKTAPVEGSLGQKRSLAVAPTIASYIIVQRIRHQRGEDISPIKVDFEPQSRNTYLDGQHKEALLEVDEPYFEEQVSLKMWDKTSSNLIVDATFHKETKIWSAHNRSANQLTEKDMAVWNDSDLAKYLQRQISQSAPKIAQEVNYPSLKEGACLLELTRFSPLN